MKEPGLQAEWQWCEVFTLRYRKGAPTELHFLVLIQGHINAVDNEFIVDVQA